MTIDDSNSIYVGGLRDDATEEELRRAFIYYGNVVAVKLQIINDREVGEKCYGFVTFTNPRSAGDAIEEMNGKTIGGRVIRVNQVRTRGGRPNFHHENFHRDTGRGCDWDRDTDHILDRDCFRDRNSEHLRDRDRDRDYERGRDFDQARDHAFDRSRDRSAHGQERGREHDQDWERDQDREMDKRKNLDTGRDKEQRSRNRPGSRFDDRRSRELSSNSSAEYQHQMKEELEISIQRGEELQEKLQMINENVDQREQAVSDLQKKCQKLENAFTAAKKLTSQRHSMLAKLNRCFLQAQDYSEKLKCSEQELKILVDSAMAEVGTGEEAGTRDGSTYVNGEA